MFEAGPSTARSAAPLRRPREDHDAPQSAPKRRCVEPENAVASSSREAPQLRRPEPEHAIASSSQQQATAPRRSLISERVFQAPEPRPVGESERQMNARLVELEAETPDAHKMYPWEQNKKLD